MPVPKKLLLELLIHNIHVLDCFVKNRLGRSANADLPILFSYKLQRHFSQFDILNLIGILFYSIYKQFLIFIVYLVRLTINSQINTNI